MKGGNGGANSGRPSFDKQGNKPVMHPSVSKFFCSVRVLPRYYEERLKKGKGLASWTDGSPADAWVIGYGHPTDALVSYFKTRYTVPPAVAQLWAAEHCHGAPREDAFRAWFHGTLIATVVRAVPECADVEHIPAMSKWKPPCGNVLGCGRGCRGLLARLCVLETAAVIATENRAWKTLNDVYAHIDSHMPLLCALTEPFHLMTDDATGAEGQRLLSAHAHVETADSRSVDWLPDKVGPYCGPANMAHFLTAAEPDITYAYTRETVPDVTALMPLALSFNHTPMSNKKVAKAMIPHLTPFNIGIVMRLTNILYKLFPHRCNNREFYTQFNKACTEDKMMREFTCKLIIATLLGVYEQSHNKMPTELRIEVYRLFYKPIGTDMLLSSLTEDNKATLLYIGKEFFHEMTERVPGFLSCLKEVYAWDVYEACTMRITDIIRARAFVHLRRTLVSVPAHMRLRLAPPLDFTALLAGTDMIVHRIHEDSRNTQTENNVGYNVYDIMKCCVDINLRRYSPAGEVMMAGEEYLMPSPHPSIPDRQLDVMRRVIATFPADFHIPFTWLLYFGVPFRHIRDMSTAVFSKLPDLHRTLEALPMDVYAIFFNFFDLCRARADFREYPCDAFMYTQHMRVLHDHHEIREGQPIPAVAGCIQVCENCGDEKYASFFERDVKNKNSKRGVVTVRGDFSCACAKVPKAADWREVRRQTDPTSFAVDMAITEHRPITQSDETARRKLAKLISTQHMLYRCRNTPTRTLNALGRIVVFRRSVIICCEQCLKVIHQEHAAYHGRRRLCESCARKLVATPDERHQCDIKPCKRRIKNARDGAYLFVYEDMVPPAERGFRTMRLCSHHGSWGWLRGVADYQVAANSILRTSFIFQTIAETAALRRK